MKKLINYGFLPLTSSLLFGCSGGSATSDNQPPVEVVVHYLSNSNLTESSNECLLQKPNTFQLSIAGINNSGTLAGAVSDTNCEQQGYLWANGTSNVQMINEYAPVDGFPVRYVHLSGISSNNTTTGYSQYLYNPLTTFTYNTELTPSINQQYNYSVGVSENGRFITAWAASFNPTPTDLSSVIIDTVNHSNTTIFKYQGQTLYNGIFFTASNSGNTVGIKFDITGTADEALICNAVTANCSYVAGGGESSAMLTAISSNDQFIYGSTTTPENNGEPQAFTVNPADMSITSLNTPLGFEATFGVTNQGSVILQSGNEKYIYMAQNQQLYAVASLIEALQLNDALSSQVYLSPNGKYLALMMKSTNFEGNFVATVYFSQGIEQYLQQNVLPYVAN